MKRLALILAIIGGPQSGMAAETPQSVAAPIPHATIQCMTGGGGFSNCKVVDEAPDGQGLGVAALIGSPCLQMETQKAGADSAAPVNQEKSIRLVIQFPGAPLPIAPNWFGCNATLLQASTPLTHPIFSKKPDGDDFVRLYPSRALDDQRDGAVVVQCSIQVNRLDPCSVLQETPEHYDFGKATLEIMKIFKVEPQDSNGLSVEGGQYRTIVLWRIG